MDLDIKELLYSRICSGSVRCKMELGSIILIKAPTLDIRYEAQEIYIDALQEARTDELMEESDLLSFLITHKGWTEDKEKRLAELPKEVENHKVELYEALLKPYLEDKRAQLNRAKNEFGRLFNARHLYDYLSVDGYATLVKGQFLLHNSMYDISGVKLTEDMVGYIYDEVSLFLSEHPITEQNFRLIARTDPHRSNWNSGEKTSFFGNVLNYTEEQKMLILWSRIYDSVFENSESPSETVINDDDMLDGWMISQRRKRLKEAASHEAEKLISSNPKIQQAGEIFVPVRNKEEASKIEGLNSPQATLIKRSKIAEIQRAGTIEEQYLKRIG